MHGAYHNYIYNFGLVVTEVRNTLAPVGDVDGGEDILAFHTFANVGYAIDSRIPKVSQSQGVALFGSGELDGS